MKYKYNEKEICKLFEQGLNSVEITKYYNMNKHNYKTITKILKNNGYNPSRKRLLYSIEDEKEICRLYKEGKTQLEILSLFKDKINVEGTIRNILIKNNIKRRRTGTRSAIKNHDYFQDIDTEKKAYFLGLIMADGCVMESSKGKTVYLGLKLKDKYIIDEFAKEIGFTGKLYIESKEEKSKRSFKSSDGFCMIRFISEKMFNDLSKYGIIPRKTSKEYIPENISNEMIYHFIRGCFDGDGSVFVSKNYLRIAYYGSHKICQDILNKIHCNNKVYNKKTVSFFCIQNKATVNKFYNYIYKDASIYLKRKKDIFDNNMQKTC